MKVLTILSILLVTGFTTAAPKPDDSNKVVVTKDFFPESSVIYESQHDIVSILVPVTSLYVTEKDYNPYNSEDITLFFVEADVDKDGKRTYKGLYVFKNEAATKLLENGREVAFSGGDRPQVFFAAQDGVYVYNPDTNTAVKYGSLTDSIIDIVKPNTDTEILYILTENHELYKVTEDGKTKTKVEEVVGAQEIVIDYTNNIYFYGQDKVPHVLTATGVKKIEGLPANPTNVKLIKAPFILRDGVPFIVDNDVYTIYANGTSVETNIELTPSGTPTAYSAEGTIIQYYGLNKKIYEFNILAQVLGDLLEAFRSFLNNNSEEIQSIARKAIQNKHKI